MTHRFLLVLVVSLGLPIFLIAQFNFSEAELAEKKVIVRNNAPSAYEEAFNLGAYYEMNGSFDKAAFYYDIVVQLSKGSDVNTIKSYFNLSKLYKRVRNTDSLMYYANKVIDATSTTKDSLSLYYRARVLGNIASNSFYNLNDYDKAYNVYRDMAEVGKRIENHYIYLSAYYDIANLHYGLETGDVIKTVDDAINTVANFEYPPTADNSKILQLRKFKAIVVADESEDPIERAEALQYYKDYIAGAKKRGRMITVVNNTAEMLSYFTQELDPDSVAYYAEYCYTEMKKRDKLSTNAGTVFLEYGKALYRQNKYERAIEVLQEAIPIFNEGEVNNTFLLETYEYLAYAYTEVNDREEWKNTFTKYKETARNLKEQVLENNIVKLEGEYETEKVEFENKALLSKNNLAESRLRFSLILGFLLLSLLATSLYFIWRIRKNEKKLEKINAGKNQLFAILAHDMKGATSTFNNLTKKVTYLIKKNQPERLLELAEYFETSGRRINFILSNLLDWAVAQKDEFVCVPQQLNVKQEVERVIEDLEYSLREKKIKIDSQIIDKDQIVFDKNALQVILRNLVHNAIKYSPKDSTIVIDYGEYGLRVQDQGIGISAETIDQIMDGQRVESTRGTESEKGNGIGLSTCIKLAEQNQANLKIDSKLGGGTVFTVAFD